MMRIKQVKSVSVQANFMWTYVRVYSDGGAGLFGTGECFFAPGLENIIRDLGELLIGEDFTGVQRLVEKMRRAASGAGSLGGIVWNAISGIEAALYDLKGKFYGLPVYQLLGGQTQPYVRIYADCHADTSLERLDPLLQPVGGTKTMPDDPVVEPRLNDGGYFERVLKHAKRYVDAGYDLLKFDLDVPGSTFDSPTGYALGSEQREWMVRLVETLRSGLGPNVDIAFDAHWRYRASDIIAIAKAIEEFHVFWLEDPLPPDDLQGLRHIRAHSGIPIATGENQQLISGFEPLILENVCDIITPDLQKAGGLGEAKAIASLANAHNKPVAVHMIGSPLALMTSVAFCIGLPNCIGCEFHAFDVPFYHELVDRDPASWLVGNRAQPVDSPGIGLELDEKVLERHRLPGPDVF